MKRATVFAKTTPVEQPLRCRLFGCKLLIDFDMTFPDGVRLPSPTIEFAICDRCGAREVLIEERSLFTPRTDFAPWLERAPIISLKADYYYKVQGDRKKRV